MLPSPSPSVLPSSSPTVAGYMVTGLGESLSSPSSGVATSTGAVVGGVVGGLVVVGLAASVIAWLVFMRNRKKPVEERSPTAVVTVNASFAMRNPIVTHLGGTAPVLQTPGHASRGNPIPAAM